MKTDGMIPGGFLQALDAGVLTSAGQDDVYDAIDTLEMAGGDGAAMRYLYSDALTSDATAILDALYMPEPSRGFYEGAFDRTGIPSHDIVEAAGPVLYGGDMSAFDQAMIAYYGS